MPDTSPKSASVSKPGSDRFRGWRRHTIGLLALVLITLGLVLLFGNVEAQGSYGVASFSLRVGFVLGALWLALPQLGAIFAKYPPWLIIGFLIMIVVAVVQPKLLLYLIPIMGVLLVFKIMGWFTRPLPAQQRERSSAGKQQRPVTVPPDSRSNPESNADKGE